MSGARLVLVMLCLLAVPTQQCFAQGKRVGGVEIGSSGIKVYATTLRTDTIRIPDRIDDLSKDAKATLKAENKAGEGDVDGNIVKESFSQEAIDRNVSLVGRYVKYLKDPLKGNVSEVYIAISSGVVLKAAELGKNEALSALIDKLNSEAGISPSMIDVRDEVGYQLDRVQATQGVPSGKTLLIDIGGGNVKFGMGIAEQRRVGEFSRPRSDPLKEAGAAIDVNQRRMRFDTFQNNVKDLAANASTQGKLNLGELPPEAIPKTVILNGGAFFGMMAAVQLPDLVTPDGQVGLVEVQGGTPAEFREWAITTDPLSTPKAPSGMNAAKFENFKPLQDRAEALSMAAAIGGTLEGLGISGTEKGFEITVQGTPYPVKVFLLENGQTTWLAQYLEEKVKGSSDLPPDSLTAIQTKIDTLQLDVTRMRTALATLPPSKADAVLKTLEERSKELSDLISKLDFAKKDDLKDLATKSDLKGLAKTSDLEGVVKTDDIKDVVRTDDLRGVVKKDDLKPALAEALKDKDLNITVDLGTRDSILDDRIPEEERTVLRLVVDRIEKRLSRVENAVGDVTGKIDGIAARIDGLDTKIDGVTTSLKTQGELLAVIHRDVLELKGRGGNTSPRPIADASSGQSNDVRHRDDHPSGAGDSGMPVQSQSVPSQPHVVGYSSTWTPTVYHTTQPCCSSYAVRAPDHCHMHSTAFWTWWCCRCRW